jgi:polyisoprenoid-binding protein YceI
MPAPSPKRRWLIWGFAGAVVLLLIGFVGVPYVYIHFIDKTAAPLTLTSNPTPTPSGSSSITATSTPPATSLDGTWTVASGSQAGYRVNEVLNGQSHTATGRTSAITGSLIMSGGSVVSGSFSADLTTVTSDQSQRDNQFQGRIMDTAQYPKATFTLTQPIVLGTAPADGVVVTRSVIGTLAMHGVTKTITFNVSIKKTGSTVAVQGDIPILFSDYNISNPSFPPLVTTDSNGILEFLINFTHFS